MNTFCGRCGNQIKTAAEYGTYVIARNIELCLDCRDKWLEIKARHYKEDSDFWEKEKGNG